MQIRQHILRFTLAQVNPLMPVAEEQFAAVAVISVYHKDPRFSEIRQAEQQAFLNLVEVPRLNEVLPVLFLPSISEKIVPNAEFRGQKSVDKCNVVMNFADLEDFLP